MNQKTIKIYLIPLMTIVLSILPWWAFANYILKFNFISFLATSTNTSNKSAIKKANRKYPNEALEIDDDNINDVAAHYDYLMDHDKIIRKISH